MRSVLALSLLLMPLMACITIVNESPSSSNTDTAVDDTGTPDASDVALDSDDETGDAQGDAEVDTGTEDAGDDASDTTATPDTDDDTSEDASEDGGEPDATACDDADEDGVCDDVDRCPGADDALDADSDGVPDGCDLCVGDDATGDTDDDGVCDDSDACSGDDATGDTDRDGVCDDSDLCRGDDAWGDADGDGTCLDVERAHACLEALTSRPMSGTSGGPGGVDYHRLTLTSVVDLTFEARLEESAGAFDVTGELDPGAGLLTVTLPDGEVVEGWLGSCDQWVGTRETDDGTRLFWINDDGDYANAISHFDCMRAAERVGATYDINTNTVAPSGVVFEGFHNDEGGEDWVWTAPECVGEGNGAYEGNMTVDSGFGGVLIPAGLALQQWCDQPWSEAVLFGACTDLSPTYSGDALCALDGTWTGQLQRGDDVMALSLTGLDSGEVQMAVADVEGTSLLSYDGSQGLQWQQAGVDYNAHFTADCALVVGTSTDGSAFFVTAPRD